MTILKFKKGQDFVWAISKDANEIYILGRRQFEKVQIKEEESAQDLINSI